MTAKSAARALLEKWISTFSLPAVITSQGPAYVAEVWKELSALLGIKLDPASVYNPNSVKVERFHHYLGAELRIYKLHHKLPWEEAIPYLLFAYRVSPIPGLGFSPFFLTFGREPTLPHQLLFGKAPRLKTLPEDLVHRLQVFKDAYLRLNKAQRILNNTNRKRYDRGRYPTDYQPGDKVFVVKQLGRKGVSKKFFCKFSDSVEVHKQGPRPDTYWIRLADGKVKLYDAKNIVRAPSDKQRAANDYREMIAFDLLDVKQTEDESEEQVNVESNDLPRSNLEGGGSVGDAKPIQNFDKISESMVDDFPQDRFEADEAQSERKDEMAKPELQLQPDSRAHKSFDFGLHDVLCFKLGEKWYPGRVVSDDTGIDGTLEVQFLECFFRDKKGKPIPGPHPIEKKTWLPAWYDTRQRKDAYTNNSKPWYDSLEAEITVNDILLDNVVKLVRKRVPESTADEIRRLEAAGVVKSHFS